MKFLCRATDHELSYRVLEAFAEGTPQADIGGVGCELWCWPDEEYGWEIPVYYGILRGCGEAIKEDMRQGRPFVYIDHGFFGDKDNVNLTGHYRIVVGGLHHKIPEWPKIEGMDWPGIIPPPARRPACAPIVLIPPSEHVAGFYGIDLPDWIRRFKAMFPKSVVSTKADGNLDSLLGECRGVLAHSSTAVIKALKTGLPAWCTAERAPIPNHGMYNPEDLLCWLAERQFTLVEIRDGRHLQFLRREIEKFRAEGVRSPSVGGGTSHTENRPYPL